MGQRGWSTWDRGVGVLGTGRLEYLGQGVWSTWDGGVGDLGDTQRYTTKLKFLKHTTPLTKSMCVENSKKKKTNKQTNKQTNSKKK